MSNETHTTTHDEKRVALIYHDMTYIHTCIHAYVAKIVLQTSLQSVTQHKRPTWDQTEIKKKVNDIKYSH